MEDDHVDRPGVEERQRLKLTGTNSSIGLIVLIPYVHLTKSDDLLPSRQSASPTPPGRASQRLGRAVALADCRPTRGWHKTQLLDYVRFADLVVMAERLHPIPFRTRP